MPMVSSDLIVPILLVAFFPSASAFFLRVPNNRLLGAPTLLMIGIAAVMLFTLFLAIASVQIVWVSWALLAIALLLLGMAIPAWKSARATKKAAENRIAERRARGH
jgi:cation transport ATPase